MPVVSIIGCKDYEFEAVLPKVDQLIRNISPEGIGAYIKPGTKVFIKPNMLMDMNPNLAVTTHPSVIRAVIRLAKAAGGIVTVGDSPCLGRSKSQLLKTYEVCGILEAAQLEGAEVLLDYGKKDIKINEGKALDSITVMREIAEADIVINIAKLKTHGFTGYTGAVKNMFGAVPGLLKAEMHARFPDMNDFANMLIDITESLKPKLSIVDGILAMEGAGPSAGTPRKLGALLAAENPHALDAVCIRLMKWDPKSICTIRQALKRELIADIGGSIRIEGAPISEFSGGPFCAANKKKLLLSMAGKYLLPQRLRSILRDRPYIDRDKCAVCGKCISGCPVGAMRMSDGKPGLDAARCIRCYCCQEVCPEHAVSIRGLLSGR